VEVIDGLNLTAIATGGAGAACYHPASLLGILVYGYAASVFSSRKLERAPYDSVAFHFTAANDHPWPRRGPASRCLPQITALLVQVLSLAHEMVFPELGTLALDGTKIHADASRHKALSYESAGKIEVQLKADVVALIARAEATDKADVPDGVSIPKEASRREDGLVRRSRRAWERFVREQAEHEGKLKAREASTKATGKKPGGKRPAPPAEGPLPTDQINLTDEDSRIALTGACSFEQCYNVQAAEAAVSLPGGRGGYGVGAQRQAAD
jgi:hypothetical protein